MYGCGLDIAHTPENLTQYYSNLVKNTIEWIL